MHICTFFISFLLQFCTVCLRQTLVRIVLAEIFPTVSFTYHDSLRFFCYLSFTPVGTMPHVPLMLVPVASSSMYLVSS